MNEKLQEAKAYLKQAQDCIDSIDSINAAHDYDACLILRGATWDIEDAYEKLDALQEDNERQLKRILDNLEA